jgi:hypothetical protein
MTPAGSNGRVIEVGEEEDLTTVVRKKISIAAAEEGGAP